MKALLFILTIQIIAIELNAQSASEVLKYSLARPYGTARALGSGEAMGALGGDFTAISINPAGIGLYRKSDFYISTGLHFDEEKSTLSSGSASPFSNSTYSETQNQFTLTGIGLVHTYEPIGSKWTNVNYALNVIKTADYNRSYYFKGRSVGSITDRFLELSIDPSQGGLHGILPDNLDAFEAGLAYETGAVYNSIADSLHPLYTTDLLKHPGYLLPKEQSLRTSGGLYDLSFGIGGNYDEVWAFGASLDIPLGSYRSESDYLEYEAVKDEVLPFKNLEFRENIHTTISGVGGKLGVIFKPIPELRIGLSWQTPRYLWLHDYYNTTLQYAYDNGVQNTSFTSYSPDGEFTYRLTIPMKTVLSAAYIARQGYISADVDFVNLKKAKFNLTADSFSSDDKDYEIQINNDIDKQYKAAIQYRLGGELILGVFRLRAGLQLLQQPYSNSDKYDKAFSLGLGYRMNRFYVDLGYRHIETEQAYSPYVTGNSDFDGNGTIDAPTPIVNQKNIQQLVQLTFGFKI